MQLQKTSAWRRLFIFKAPQLCANHFFLVNHTSKLFWHSNLNEPERKNFVLIIIQLSKVDIQPSSKLFELLVQMSSLFIHVTNFKITITNLNSKFCICYLKSWHFLNNWVSNFLEERSSTIYSTINSTLPLHTIWEWRTEIRKFDLMFHTTRPFIKYNLRFRMQGP